MKGGVKATQASKKVAQGTKTTKSVAKAAESIEKGAARATKVEQMAQQAEGVEAGVAQAAKVEQAAQQAERVEYTTKVAKAEERVESAANVEQIIQGASEQVQEAYLSATAWLGEGCRAIVNQKGDLILMSKDGLRKFRTDFYDKKYPKHVHLQEFRNGKWRDAIPGIHHIYPKGD